MQIQILNSSACPTGSITLLNSPEGKNIMTFFHNKRNTGFYKQSRHQVVYELVYIEKGELRIETGNYNFRLRSHELLIIDHNKWDSLFSYGKATVLVISFYVTGESIDIIENQRLKLAEKLQPIMFKISEEHKNCRKFSKEYIESLLKILLIELLQQYTKNQNKITQPVFPETLATSNDILNTTLQIIHDCIDQKIFLNDLAKEVHVSPSCLNRLFRQYLHESPAKYITKTRLRICKNLLEDGELPISAIAKNMGYTSVQHFSHQFRQYFGMSPSEYSNSCNEFLPIADDTSSFINQAAISRCS